MTTDAQKIKEWLDECDKRAQHIRKIQTVPKTHPQSEMEKLIALCRVLLESTERYRDRDYLSPKQSNSFIQVDARESLFRCAKVVGEK